MFKGIMITASVLAAVLAATPAHAEDSNWVNYGNCRSQGKLNSQPGKPDNGPLTIVVNKHGERVNVPRGFDGAVGCTDDWVNP